MTVEIDSDFGRAADGTFRVRENDGVIGNPREAIFPIFIRESANELRPIGTGFFISSAGIFVTAAHVLNESLDEQGNLVKGITILHRILDRHYWRPVLQTTTHPLADIAIGVASPMKHIETEDILSGKCLALANYPPMIGELAVTYAFPATTVTEEPPAIDMQSGWYSGRVQEYFPRGRDRTRPGPCYQTSIALHGGASGGPVFDSRGKVFAVDNSSFAGAPDVSFVSCISSILVLQVEGIIHPDTQQLVDMTLLEMADRKFISFE